ncbi:hypothetical protein PR048_016812 [Dryococelus australis]|uniref:Uncharacterized protein n=1 Tax=Dryococelus australis TaxID=614101 RepID=A0ABQ9H801_9NEOP|nr:hypothetical protein PR048_016812 [Dryococelus australis]
MEWELGKLFALQFHLLRRAGKLVSWRPRPGHNTRKHTALCLVNTARKPRRKTRSGLPGIENARDSFCGCGQGDPRCLDLTRKASPKNPRTFSGRAGRLEEGGKEGVRNLPLTHFLILSGRNKMRGKEGTRGGLHVKGVREGAGYDYGRKIPANVCPNLEPTFGPTLEPTFAPPWSQRWPNLGANVGPTLEPTFAPPWSQRWPNFGANVWPNLGANVGPTLDPTFAPQKSKVKVTWNIRWWSYDVTTWWPLAQRLRAPRPCARLLLFLLLMFNDAHCFVTRAYVGITITITVADEELSYIDVHYDDSTTAISRAIVLPPNKLATVRLLASHKGEPGSISGRVTPDHRKGESCLTLPLVGGFSLGSPVSLVLAFRRRSILLISPSSAVTTSNNKMGQQNKEMHSNAADLPDTTECKPVSSTARSLETMQVAQRGGIRERNRPWSSLGTFPSIRLV